MLQKFNVFEQTRRFLDLQGILEPQSTTQVPLIVAAQDLEELGTTVHFTIVGNPGVTLVSVHDFGFCWSSALFTALSFLHHVVH
jgi:hypothetical protein